MTKKKPHKTAKSGKPIKKKKAGKKKRKTGEQVRTQRGKALFLQALQKSLNIQGACNSTGIGRSTFGDWQRNDPEFAAKVRNAEFRKFDHLEDSLMELTREKPVEERSITGTGKNQKTTKVIKIRPPHIAASIYLHKHYSRKLDILPPLKFIGKMRSVGKDYDSMSEDDLDKEVKELEADLRGGIK